MFFVQTGNDNPGIERWLNVATAQVTERSRAKTLYVTSRWQEGLRLEDALLEVQMGVSYFRAIRGQLRQRGELREDWTIIDPNYQRPGLATVLAMDMRQGRPRKYKSKKKTEVAKSAPRIHEIVYTPQVDVTTPPAEDAFANITLSGSGHQLATFLRELQRRE